MLFRIYYLDNLSKFGRSSDANSFTVLSQALSLAKEFKRKCGQLVSSFKCTVTRVVKVLGLAYLHLCYI